MTDPSSIFLSELTAAAPAGYVVSLHRHMLRLKPPDGYGVGMGAGWLSDLTVTRADIVTEAADTLHQVQSEFAEHTAEPWPSKSGPDYAGFPDPAGELDGRKLRLWFGDRLTPVLMFSPIALAD